MKCNIKILTAMATITVMLLSGCTTQSRIVDEPLAGVYRQSVDSLRAKEQSSSIVYRLKGEHFSHLGIAQSTLAKVEEEQAVMRYYYDGRAKSDLCVGGTLLTFGMWWIADTTAWALQLGTQSTSCWSQVIDSDPHQAWANSKYYNGYTVNYYKINDTPIKLDYHGKLIKGRFVEDGVWQFENNQLPAGFNIEDIKVY